MLRGIVVSDNIEHTRTHIIVHSNPLLKSSTQTPNINLGRKNKTLASLDTLVIQYIMLSKDNKL